MRSVVVFIAMTLWLAFPGDALAKKCRLELVPYGLTNGCITCHTNPAFGGPRNDFGKDIESILEPDTPCEENLFWGPALAALDSDGDGKTNGEELQDPEGLWLPGDADPGDLARVSNPGFTPDPLGPFLRGDANDDGRFNIADVSYTCNKLFLEGSDFSCVAAADANGDGSIDLADASFALEFQFRGGVAIPDPFSACATSVFQSDSDLGCEDTEGCR